MLKQISILIIICFAAFGVSAQTEKYTAPVKWERYAVGDKSVSILFPKLPVLIESAEVCSEMEKREYAAYAERVVYGLNIVSQSARIAPDTCPRFLRKFDEQRFEDRVLELTAILKIEKPKKITRNDLEIIKLSNELFAYWLINDSKNKRWLEVWTTEQDENKTNIRNFVESIRLEKNLSGIEIGEGASRTLGDEKTSDPNTPTETKLKEEAKTEIQRVRIILSPRPAYTEEARRASTVGVVRLKVTFLANGGIGAITAVATLPDGLTEKAIAAASKMVFLPAKKSDAAISSVSTVEYSFSIY